MEHILALATALKSHLLATYANLVEPAAAAPTRGGKKQKAGPEEGAKGKGGKKAAAGVCGWVGGCVGVGVGVCMCACACTCARTRVVCVCV